MTRVGSVRVATAVIAAVIALVLAGCGDDGDSTTTEATLSPEQKIEQTGEGWAQLFAADDRKTCRYMTQPLCERIACERISEPIENCTPPSPSYRKSFEDATVEDIAIGGRKAAARFSNGEAIELDHVSGYELGGIWLIHKLGGNAGRGFALSE
jgi:hypothetical protein